VTFTYLIDCCGVSPILALTSPEKRCGKTTALDLLSKLSHKAMPASNISPAAVFRSIDAWSPCLLIDEADTFLSENEELRGVLNSGHTRATAFVVRNVGDDHQPRQFSTWGAKAIAKIGTLPDTLADRSIVVELRRRLPSERVQKLRHVEAGLFDELRRKLVRFAGDNAETLRNARPTIPEALNDRAGDSWEPLLAIAEIAGGARGRGRQSRPPRRFRVDHRTAIR
jgi:putative DNA primase/helicase